MPDFDVVVEVVELVSEPVEPVEPVDPVEPVAPVPEDPVEPDMPVEPEVVVSDDEPVVPEPVVPEPVPPEPVELLGALEPLPMVLEEPLEPGVVDDEPLLLGLLGLVVLGLVVVVVDVELPVSRPSVRLRSEHAPRAKVASAAATATPIACVFKCFIVRSCFNAGRVPERRPGPPAPVTALGETR